MAHARNALQGRKQDFVRGEIWRAAVDLFATRGYDATTVDEIAEATGLSRRTFFRYFASKDDLMVKAIDSYGDLLTTAIRNTSPDAAPLALVKQAVIQVAEAVLAEPRVRDSMAISMNSTAARRAQLGELEIVTDRIAGEFQQVLGRRARNAYTARMMASLTMAALTHTFRVWYDRPTINVDQTVNDILIAATDLLQGTSSSLRPVRRAQSPSLDPAGGRHAPRL
jgi:AcrR family transcriptional regulator